MKTKIALLTLFVTLTGLNSVLAQRGIGTLEPKATLHVEGEPATTTTPDGVKAPVLTLAQLEAKLAAYGADQDGAFVYVDDVTAGSTTAETCKIVSGGYYYYNASNDVWEALGSKRYCVGDFAQGGVVFWVDETAEHGLVAAKQDQSSGIRWFAGTFPLPPAYDARATGDGPFAGELNTALIIVGQTIIGDDGNDYAAQICNDLQITEGGKTYGDWYLPSSEELILIAQNKAIINTTASANGGSSLSTSGFYWSSTELNSDIVLGINMNVFSAGFVLKSQNWRVRAVRRF